MPDNVTQIPASRVPLTEATGGIITREWYRFFQNVFNLTSAGNNTVSLSDLQKGPLSTDSMAVVAPRYGTFFDSTTQTAALANTAYGMTFNNTDLSFGVEIGSPTSRVYVRSAGVFNIQFSAQLDNTSGGAHLVYIWLRVNGTNIPNSASKIRLQGSSAETIAAWNFVYNFKSDDYFELMWSVSNTATRILAEPAAGVVPAIPSIILTVTDNISA
jgi:hypothetical protein